MEESILDRISQVAKWLKEEKIEHVLVGGVALNLWGGQVATFDVDIAIPLLMEEEKRDSAVQLLFRKGFRVVEPQELADCKTEDAIAYVRGGGQHLKFLDSIMVDLVFWMEGVDMRNVHKNSHRYRFPSGEGMRVISFEDLMENKKAIVKKYRSAKDMLHLQQLEILLNSTGEKKPVTGEWVQRLRKIRGTVHLVRVRKVKGRQEVRVII